MQRYKYKLVTSTYEAEGQIDAEDETAAEKMLRDQVANPRHRPDTQVERPTIKSLSLTLED